MSLIKTYLVLLWILNVTEKSVLDSLWTFKVISKHILVLLWMCNVADKIILVMLRMLTLLTKHFRFLVGGRFNENILVSCGCLTSLTKIF